MEPGDEESLKEAIDRSIAINDPAECNREITWVHHRLSEALSKVLGEEVGANFHSWAVWGSKKAGQTIRQEDLDSALHDATIVAGLFGAVIGMVSAWGILQLEMTPAPSVMLVLAGVLPGSVFGALAGRAIARYSRGRAARLVLEGNRTVLEDIGSETARFVETFSSEYVSEEKVQYFVDQMRPGKTEKNGQDLLKEAFSQYARAADRELSLGQRQLAAYHGNCLAIYHEHIRLQPIIVGSMPWIIRRCVTQRMMHYEIGPVILSVAEEFPDTDTMVSVPESSLLEAYLHSLGWQTPSKSGEGAPSAAAGDWTRITHRMRYVLELFRRYHLDAGVKSEPW